MQILKVVIDRKQILNMPREFDQTSDTLKLYQFHIGYYFVKTLTI